VHCGYFLLGPDASLSSVRMRSQFARSFANPRSAAEGRPGSIVTFTELPDSEVINVRSHFALNSKLIIILFTQRNEYQENFLGVNAVGA